MLEADKDSSKEKVLSTEAVADKFLHSYSAVPLKSYCSHYNQTVAQTDGWKS